MKKIPVLPTIQAAYRFTFTHLGTIIGLIWLPMLVVTVLGFFVKRRYYAAAADAFASNNYAALGPSLVMLLCYFIAAFLLYAVMYVPVVQLAMGSRKEGTLLHFAFGPAEWRLFRALMGVFAFLMMPAIGAGLVLSLVQAFAGPAHGIPERLGQEGVQLLAVLAYLGLAYIGVRFLFLIPAVATSEEGAVLPRTWKLSVGNFWRMVGVIVGTAGPVLVVAMIVDAALAGSDAMMPDFTNSTAVAAAEFRAMAANMPVTEALGFLIGPLLLGLISSASAYSFAALKDSASIPPP